MDDVQPDYIEIDNLIGLGFNALSEIARRDVPVAYMLHDLNLACFNTGMIRKGRTCKRQCFSCRGVAVLRQTHLNKIKRLGFISPSHANLERAKKLIPAVSRSLSCVIRNVPEEIPSLPEREKSDYIRLLFAGRLDPVKGIGFLLRTLDKMSSAYKFHLTVLGTGPDEQRLKAEFGQKTWVTFRGFVPKDDVAAALAESDLYCMPSLVAESYGLVTAQALRLGTPVIGSDAGGTAELVRDDITGILLPPGDGEAWQDAFSKIFSNPELLTAWRENAVRHAYEFDEKAIGQAHDAFIEKLSVMRVLHIVRQFYPAVGGLESYVRNMIEHQQRLGHECAVLTLNRVFHGRNKDLPAYEMMDGIPVHRVPFLGKRRFFIPLVTPSFLNNYDIIHVHNTDGFFDYISLLSGHAGRPAFATTHGGFFHTKDFSAIKKIYFGLVTRNAGRRYRALFAISRNDYRIFKGVNDNLLLKPNAIAAPGDFIAAGEDFVYLGRLAKHKNVAAIIETFAFLKIRHGIAGRLHIIGPEWDVKQTDLASLAARLDVERDVFFHGFLAPEEMREVLRGCGWFLSASSFEGFGMSMLEAMAVGLIPFVQPNESFRDLVDACGVGACVDFTRPERAAAEIVGRLDAIGAGDREKARFFALQFSWEKLAEDTIAAYRRYGR
ncbi:MAG: glycosyltransferase [Micavibrio sp.]